MAASLRCARTLGRRFGRSIWIEFVKLRMADNEADRRACSKLHSSGRRNYRSTRFESQLSRIPVVNGSRAAPSVFRKAVETATTITSQYWRHASAGVHHPDRLAAANDPDAKTKKRQVCEAHIFTGEPTSGGQVGRHRR
jgi:hypothetical protein